MRELTIIILSLLVLIYGCASSEVSFNRGVKKVEELDSKHGASLKMAPNSTAEIESLLFKLKEFKTANKLSKPLEHLVDFKVAFLEAEKLNAEGWQWGKGSTIDYGFGCKNGYARIKESGSLRNASAQKGYEALAILEKFIAEYPKEAKSSNLTQKDALLFNAMYFQIEEKAAKDVRIVKSVCGKKNETIEG